MIEQYQLNLFFRVETTTAGRKKLKPKSERRGKTIAGENRDLGQLSAGNESFNYAVIQKITSGS